MNRIDCQYQITVGDYRKAVYYATFLRHRRLLQIFVLTAIVAFLCWLGSALGLFPLFLLPAYLFFGYAIWVLLLFGQLEWGILQFCKRDTALLGKETQMLFTRNSMTLTTPQGETVTHPLDRLFLAFELSGLFLFYLDGAQSLLLPTRSLDGSKRNQLREWLQEALHERFETRYGLRGLKLSRKPVSNKKFF